MSITMKHAQVAMRVGGHGGHETERKAVGQGGQFGTGSYAGTLSPKLAERAKWPAPLTNTGWRCMR
jgi:hypothetical protein